MFHPANVALKAHYPDNNFTAIQLHGIAEQTCPGVDVMMSYGLSNVKQDPTQKLMILYAKLQEITTWAIHYAGDGSGCTMIGTTNPQGRYMNGVPEDQLCNQPASSYAQTWIHIEQKLPQRTDVKNLQLWIEALSGVF